MCIKLSFQSTKRSTCSGLKLATWSSGEFLICGEREERKRLLHPEIDYIWWQVQRDRENRYENNQEMKNRLLQLDSFNDGSRLILCQIPKMDASYLGILSVEVALWLMKASFHFWWNVCKAASSQDDDDDDDDYIYYIHTHARTAYLFEVGWPD